MIQLLSLIFISTCVLLSFPASAGAANVIHVETEPGGNIDTVPEDGVFENVDGAMFWNGTGWGVNETYGHLYFIWLTCDPQNPGDCVEGQKLKDFITTQAPCQAEGSGVEVLREMGPEGTEYRAIHNVYTYSKIWQGTEYIFTAAEFDIQLVWAGTNNPTGPRLVLRSRSANATALTPYFDVYIENEDGTTEAFRSDPVWFHYPMSIDQAVTQTDTAAYRMGDLPTASSQYWLDIDGGSEMGGKTFKLITSALLDTELNGAGTSFISECAIQYTDAEGALRQLLFCPHVYSVFAQSSAAIPTLSQFGSVLLSMCLAVLAVRFLRARRKSR